MLVMQKIEEIAYKSSGSTRTIGEFLIINHSRLQDFSMQQIVDETFTSKSTLSRFAKSLGFDGWKSMMEQLLKHDGTAAGRISFHYDSPCRYGC